MDDTLPQPPASRTPRSVELWIFRHGQTDWNREGRIQGHLDIPLNDEGRGQAKRLIEPLKQLKIQGLLSSDLSRARETAEIVGSPLNLRVVTDERLREVHLGALQGLTKKEIEAKHGFDFRTKLKTEPLSDSDVARLGSETGGQVLTRALEALFHHLDQNPDHSRIAVATHGGVLRHLIQHGQHGQAAAQGSIAFPPSVLNGVLYPFEVILNSDANPKLHLLNLTRI